jgi:hypothetical protein
VARLQYRHRTKGKDMPRKALVFLQKRGTEGESYLGPKLIDPTPSLGSRVAFVHEGRTLAGQVDPRHPGLARTSRTVAAGALIPRRLGR